MSQPPEYYKTQVPTYLQELIPEFIANRQQDIPRIREAVKTGDWDTARVLGHDMKGCGLGYGFPLLSEWGANIEIGAKEKNAAVIHENVVRLEDYLQNVVVTYEDE